MENNRDRRSLSPASEKNRRPTFSQTGLRLGDTSDEDDPRPSSSSLFLSESERCSSAQSDASSWVDEGEGSRRGWLLLQRLTEGLYSDQKLTGQLGEECELWKKAFPHFRLEGHAMTLPPPGALQSRPDSPTAEEEQVFASNGTPPPHLP